FQAEDGIRDFHVTGVQTCALPILVDRLRDAPQALVENAGGAAYVTGVTPLAIDVSEKLAEALPLFIVVIVVLAMILLAIAFRSRSEERRVGKECRSRGQRGQ